GDWEHEGVVTPQTRFIADLGLESLDLVVLGTLLQQEYGPLPFAEFLAELGTRPVEARDVTVLELVDFISVHRSVPASQGALWMVGTLLLGLDGATSTVRDPLMRSGVMPTLRELADRGCRAPLRTVMPPLTPPGWTSLVTGRRPGRHGVFDFFRKE